MSIGILGKSRGDYRGVHNIFTWAKLKNPENENKREKERIKEIPVDSPWV